MEKRNLTRFKRRKGNSLARFESRKIVRDLNQKERKERRRFEWEENYMGLGSRKYFIKLESK